MLHTETVKCNFSLLYSASVQHSHLCLSMFRKRRTRNKTHLRVSRYVGEVTASAGVPFGCVPSLETVSYCSLVQPKETWPRLDKLGWSVCVCVCVCVCACVRACVRACVHACVSKSVSVSASVSVSVIEGHRTYNV